MSLTSIVYVSAARALLSDDEIQDLLRQSRANNAVRDVTGLLLYWDGNFLQCLEGPRGAVETLMSRILLDPRHSGVIVLNQTDIAERAFPDWRMGFQRMRLAATAEQSGVSNYLADGVLEADSGALAPPVRHLIEMFRRHLR